MKMRLFHPATISLSLIVFLVLAMLALSSPQRALAQDGLTNTPVPGTVVTNVNDSGSGSLRQVIANASSGSIITFDPSLAGQTITLASQINIAKNLTVDGSGLEPQVSISGNNIGRILNIGNSTVHLYSLILKDGKMTGTSYQYFGGAVYADLYAQVIAEHVTFLGNSAYKAGAIYVSPISSVTILNSEFISNSAQAEAGAIYVAARGSLFLQNSKVDQNSAASAGGAIYFDQTGTLKVEKNTFSSNVALSGGAISIFQNSNSNIGISDNLFLLNTTTGTSRGGGAIDVYYSSLPSMLVENNTFLSNHSANLGGAILSEGYLTLNQNTFSENRADKMGGTGGGSLYLLGIGTTQLNNNIFANNGGGTECAKFSSNVLVTGSNNLVEDGSAACLPSLTGNPNLDTLADNGGPTLSLALLPGSSAIDSANDTTCLLTDQRGVARPQGPHCDLGAFEYVSSIPSETATTTVTATVTTLPVVTFTPTVTATVTDKPTVTATMTARPTLTPTYTTTPTMKPTVTPTVTATIQTYIISGFLGVKGAGATISFTGGTTIADSQGNYSFSIPSGWTGTITPSKVGYRFLPSSIVITSPVTGNLPNQNFTTKPANK